MILGRNLIVGIYLNEMSDMPEAPSFLLVQYWTDDDRGSDDLLISTLDQNRLSWAAKWGLTIYQFVSLYLAAKSVTDNICKTVGICIIVSVFEAHLSAPFHSLEVLTWHVQIHLCNTWAQVPETDNHILVAAYILVPAKNYR